MNLLIEYLDYFGVVVFAVSGALAAARARMDVVGFALLMSISLRPDSGGRSSVTSASDMVVFPAIRPHQARPAFEAGAMAKPIIASQFDCLKESITDRVNGLFFPPENPQALAKVIIELANSKELVATMGQKNWEYAVAFHDKIKNCRMVFDIYDECLSTIELQNKDTLLPKGE